MAPCCTGCATQITDQQYICLLQCKRLKSFHDLPRNNNDKETAASISRERANSEGQTQLHPIRPLHQPKQQGDLNSGRKVNEIPQENKDSKSQLTQNHCTETAYELQSICSDDATNLGQPVPESYWHLDCLRCSMCNVLLATQATCYVRDQMVLCKKDYLR